MIEIKIGTGHGRLRRMLLLWLGVLLLLWLAYLVREIWLPLLISLLIAMVLDPLVDRLERHGWARWSGALLIYAVFFVVAGTLLTLTVPAIISQGVNVTSALNQYLPGDTDTQTRRSLEHLLHKVHASPFVANQVMRASSQISRTFGQASAWFGNMAAGMVYNLIWIVVIPIISFYALKDLHLLYARLLLLIPRDHRTYAQQFINDVTAIFVRYLRGLVIVCTLNGGATAVVLALGFHLPNALALGAISGTLYMVPYLGPILTVLMVAGIALMFTSIKTTLIIIATLIFLHSVLFDQIITPRILGKQVGLHPILSILALLIGGSLLGIVGMILAVPIAATVQMVLQTLFPKLNQPIEVPAGEELHAMVQEIEQGQPPESAVEHALDVHQTIVAAVDTAEDQAQEQKADQKEEIEEDKQLEQKQAQEFKQELTPPKQQLPPDRAA